MDHKLGAISATVLILLVQAVPGLVIASTPTISSFELPRITSQVTMKTISYSGVGPTTISLNWTGSDDPKFFAYSLQESNGPRGPWNTIANIYDNTTTSYYDYGLTPGASEWWQVDYLQGTPSLSNPLNVSQPTSASLTFSSPNSTSAKLAWDNSAVYGGLLSFSSYQVMESTNTGPYTMVKNITDLTTLSYTAMSLVSSNSYSFYINTTDYCNSCTTSLLSSSTSDTVHTHALAFATGAQSLTAGACSDTVTIQVQDEFGNPSNAFDDTTVNLSTTSSGGTFYSDSACTMLTTSATIHANTHSTSYFYNDTEAGSPIITVSATDLTSDTQVETVNPAGPTNLVATTTPQTLTAGVCSTGITIQTRDSFGNPSNVTADATIGLATNPSVGTFYSDSACTNQITTTTVAANTNSTSFFYSDTEAGSPAITASSPGFTSATQTETVTATAASRLTFTTPGRTITVKACSAIMTVKVKDSFGNPSNVVSDTTVNLSTTSTAGIFYSDSGCTTPVTLVTISSGMNSASFFYKDADVDSPVINASASGLNSAVQVETLSPAPPSNLVFASSAVTLTAGACSSAIIVQTQDSYGNPSEVTVDTTVNLATTSSAVTFYSDSGCTSTSGSAIIVAGTDSTLFFYNDTTAGSNTITASVTGLTIATQTETINPATASKLAFTTPAQTIGPGVCSSAIGLQTQDMFGNPSNPTATTTVSLSTASTAGAFYSDSACTTAITSMSIAAGSNSASIFYKDNNGGSPTITASANGLTSADQAESVLSASATAFPNAVGVGQQISVSCKGSGGTPPYSYTWSFGDGPDSTGANVTHTYNRPGTMYPICAVTDSSDRHAIATIGVPIIVSPDPFIASFAASPANLVLGGRVDFNVSATGGEGALSYSYTGLPAGCYSANTSLLSCTPTAAGNYNVTVTITDHAGKSATATVRLSISKQPSPFLSDLMLTFVGIGATIATIGAGAVVLLRRKR